MNFDELDTLMSGMIERGIPECEMIVTVGTEPVYHRNVGYSDAARTRPSAPGDIYAMFSCTKVVTCVAAMRLIEEGKMSLSDPVSRYLPEYGTLTVKDETGEHPARVQMNILHLFTMTGGLDYDLTKPALIRAAKDPGATTRSVVAAMAEDPLCFEPGTHYRYSLCHDVLAAVVEVVSGMRFSDYVAQVIFRPLGLSDIGFRLTKEQRTRLSTRYRADDTFSGAIPVSPEIKHVFFDGYDSGGAGLYSTASDYAAFLAVLGNGGVSADGYRLLRPETLRMLQENHLCDAARRDFTINRFYGYGWGLCGRVHLDPQKSFSLSSVGSFGWDGAAASYGLVDPEKRLSLFFATHLLNSGYCYHILHPQLVNTVYRCLAAQN